MTKIDDTLPPISWRELESILMTFAETPTKQRMVRHLVEGARKQAPFLTPHGVMREVFCIAAAMLDVQFSPAIFASDSSEASWSSSASPPSPPGS